MFENSKDRRSSSCICLQKAVILHRQMKNCKWYIFLFVFLALSVGCHRADTDARTLYEQGKALREAKKPAEAMQCFIHATHSSTRDEALLGRIYSNIANMCRQANEHALAFRVYTLSADHFAASGDTLAYAYALNNMAWEQATMGHKDSALALVQAALTVYPQDPVIEKVRESRAAACLFAGEYDSVLLHTTPPADDYLLTLRAQAYSYMQMDDSATYYAQQLLSRTTNLFALEDLYYILTHNDAEADRETIVERSSERADIQKAIEQRHGQLMQAIQILQEELAQKKSLTHYLWAVVVLMLMIACLAFVAWRVNSKRTLLRAERSSYEQLRRTELTQNILFLRSASNLRQELAWDEYREICRRTDKLFNGLASRLQAEGLNEQDIRLCVLVLAGMSHKEIADMLNCSVKSIGKLKDLTARKLGVSGGQLQDKLQKTAIL